MSERFTTSPVRLRPLAEGGTAVESGGASIRLSAEEDDELIRTGNPGPTIKTMRILKGEELVDELADGGDLGGGWDGDEVNAWIEKHAGIDRLDVDLDVGQVSAAEIAPLVTVARKHGLAIDLNLRSDA